jgi:uncharacterized protein YndB with AHSA1/START domain
VPNLTERWWAHHNTSDWQPGSPWQHRRLDGAIDIAGHIIHSEPPTRLGLTWANPDDGSPVAGLAPATSSTRQRPSTVHLVLTTSGDVTRLHVTHEDLVSPSEAAALAAGWAPVLSNLKTFLETGEPLPTPPWEILTGFVR